MQSQNGFDSKRLSEILTFVRANRFVVGRTAFRTRNLSELLNNLFSRMQNLLTLSKCTNFCSPFAQETSSKAVDTCPGQNRKFRPLLSLNKEVLSLRLKPLHRRPFTTSRALLSHCSLRRLKNSMLVQLFPLPRIHLAWIEADLWQISQIGDEKSRT